MKRRHFEVLRPVCPVCRSEGEGAALRLAQVEREKGEEVIEGALHCSNPNCLREYPVIDGIPFIVAHIRRYVGENILALCSRRDLSGFTETMLGDCCGPGSAFEQTRQQLSSYAWDHYGDLDPQERAEGPRPGSIRKSLEAGLALAGPSRGPIIDLGCSVGRGTFALAERSGDLVLGVDLNAAMLRLATEVLRTSRVRYARRRAGLVYERREFKAQFAGMDNVDFWACDATALPFPPGTFALAVNLNVLDCVQGPRELLVSLGQVLKPGGRAVLTCPYDWSPTATPLEAWLGGHSQRSPAAGSCEAMLKALLTPNSHPASINTLKFTAEQDDLPWHVRLHDRSVVSYKLHMVVAERVEPRPSNGG